MTPPSIFHHHHLLLPSASPTQILNPFATSSCHLNHQLPKPIVLSLPSRPVISSAFAVAAVGDDEDVVVGDCLVFDDDAFEEPDLNLPSSPLPRASASRHGRRAEAGEGESLVPERWRDAEEEINLTKKEKRRIAHGLRFGSRLERRAPPAIAAPDEFRAYRKGMLSAERDHIAYVYRGPLERAFLPEVEEPPPPEPGTRVAPRNPRMGMDVGSLEDIDEFFRSREYVQDEMEDSKSPKGEF